MQRNICSVQGEIQQALGRIKRELDAYPEASNVVCKPMDDAERLSEEAIERGKAMEKRLEKYHNAIVGLGFARRNKIRD